MARKFHIEVEQVNPELKGVYLSLSVLEPDDSGVWHMKEMLVVEPADLPSVMGYLMGKWGKTCARSNSRGVRIDG